MDHDQKLELTSVLEKSDNILFRIVDDEAIIVHIDSNEVLVLNEVGARVVEIMENPTSVVDLLAQLIEEFDVEMERLEADIFKHLEELLTENVLVFQECLRS